MAAGRRKAKGEYRIGNNGRPWLKDKIEVNERQVGETEMGGVWMGVAESMSNPGGKEAKAGFVLLGSMSS
jgi:hypothetical protein